MSFLLFNINTGDNYYTDTSSFWSDLPIQIIAALLGFIGAWLIFKIGNEKEKKEKTKIEKDTEISLLSFIKISLQRSINAIVVQKKYLDYFVNTVNINNPNINLKINTSVNFEWITSIKMIDFRKSFFQIFGTSNKDKSYYFNEFINHTIHLKKVHEKMETDNEIIRNSIKNYVEEFDKAYLNFQKKTLIILDKIPISSKLPQFEKELSDILRHYTYSPQEIRENPAFKYYTLIAPIRGISKEFKRNDAVDEIKAVTYYYKYLNQSFNTLIYQFTGYRNSYKASGNRLSVIARRLQEIRELD